MRPGRNATWHRGADLVLSRRHPPQPSKSAAQLERERRDGVILEEIKRDDEAKRKELGHIDWTDLEDVPLGGRA